MNKYIQFQNQTKTKQQLTTWQRFLKKVLEFLLPRANPDYDNKIDEVYTWLVEIDANDNAAREIGLDGHDRVIVVMPTFNNFGYWTDTNLKLRDFEELFRCSIIRKEIFETYWLSATKET